MRSVVVLGLLLLLSPALGGKFRPRVPWSDKVEFVYDREVSDNFQGTELDLRKWDPHGVRVLETGCPRWNGPPSSTFPDYATFFPTTTNPETGDPTEKQYRLRKGKLLLRMAEKPLEYFMAREYYCNATTFKCNHDDTIDCFATDVFGNPKYTDSTKTMFKGVVHDKCKKEPYCIPHPEHVTGKPRVYKKFIGAHLTGKKSFKYGYVEVMVKLGASPAVAAAWMHDDNMVNGYCRIRTNPDPTKTRPKLECPSLIRSRRWQEIDVVESMNSRIHRRRYIPNIHAFSGYKGEFTSATAVDSGDGNAGGGPIIVEPRVFELKNPNFSDVPEELRRGNDYHYNPGSVYELDEDWARKKRRVGMYWSPNEIRFLIDGKEVRRVKNNLIHQPMFLDLSYALNVAWAQEFPTARQIRIQAKFFHFRRWEVFTPDGLDPPSELPLDTDQDRDFENLYGTELLGVFGRFPVNDNLTVVLTNPDMANTMEAETSVVPEADGSVRSWVSGNYKRRVLSSRMGDGRRGRKKRATEDGEEAKLLRRAFQRAGGVGNMRYPSQVQKMSKQELRVAESRDDRMAVVRNGEAEVLEDGGITAYEFEDPNRDQAGWSTPLGRGLEADDMRMGASREIGTR